MCMCNELFVSIHTGKQVHYSGVNQVRGDTD